MTRWLIDVGTCVHPHTLSRYSPPTPNQLQSFILISRHHASPSFSYSTHWTRILNPTTQDQASITVDSSLRARVSPTASIVTLILTIYFFCPDRLLQQSSPALRSDRLSPVRKVRQLVAFMSQTDRRSYVQIPQHTLFCHICPPW